MSAVLIATAAIGGSAASQPLGSGTPTASNLTHVSTCRSVAGASWIARIQDRIGVRTVMGSTYLVETNEVGCAFARNRLALLTRLTTARNVRNASWGNWMCHTGGAPVMALHPPSASGTCSPSPGPQNGVAPPYFHWAPRTPPH